MPYKDPMKQKEAQRRAMSKVRGVNPAVNPDDVNPLREDSVNPITRAEMMSNLADRLRRFKSGEYTFREEEYQKVQPVVETPRPSSSDAPAVVRALADPVKRGRLVKIYASLKERKLLEEVRYGIHGPTFDVVGELLEATT